MICPVILQVFFDGSEASDQIASPIWYSRSKDEQNYKGIPYWQAPDGKGPIYRWSIDMVVCGDERWIVFGPFKDRDEALLKLLIFLPNWLLGYRIINEHCAAYCGALGQLDKSKPQRTFEFYREAWTDG